MSERLLAMLLQQALLLSVGVLLVAALRPLLLKRLGAGATYAAWLLLPALLATPLLPRPAQEPLRLVLQATGTPAATAVPALPAPTPDHATVWLVLWLGVSALLVALQAWRQWRLVRLGPQLPVGSCPALVGLLRPRIALPVDFEQRFSATERELILAHEQVHRSRGDNAWNLIACLLTALHWWNPLVWWAARRMQADQELACDAAVLAARPGAVADYTRALLAAHDLRPHAAPLASRWGSTHPLVERIAMLNRPLPLTRRRAVLVAAPLLGLAGLAYAAQQPAAPADTTPVIELKLALSYSTGRGDTRNTYSTQATLRVHDGKQARLMLNGSPDKPMPEQVGIAITPRDIGNGKIELRTELQKGDPLTTVSRPRLITSNGVKGLIEQGRDDPTGSEHLSLAVTPTLLTAQSQP
ncbi:M56 family metallopeptidase [Roseateles asaccharophilus]|uniref:Beta-lactamase regulating signal transducer with metallopeptidase domain n=1 Tax=Roseateles asaccharophilus TaxID=582607 RepID=A0ABU2A2C1_9BURK|nr:M56 family metallopeptidase [Roseateles asaccharophilus]MDR7331314.1 beta-lactamase regulating signal transducer with metallopeptidase domain [Roseateles asaccharophilus]